MMRGLGFAFAALLAVSNGYCQQSESDRFFQAIAHKDPEAAMAMWAADSPHFVSAREDLRRLFAPNRIRVAEISPGRAVFYGLDHARTYVSTDIEVYDTVTGKPVEGFGRKNKLFDWVKEADRWKIWRYAPAEAELADALIAAGSAPDRARLMAASKELVTSDLVRVLYNEGAEAARNGQPRESLRLSDLAIEAGAALGDKAALGWAYIKKAAILRDQADNAVAGPLAQRGLELFLQMQDRRGEAAARLAAGSIYSRNAEFDKASIEFEASLKLAKEISDRSAEAAARESIGEALRLTGKLFPALTSFQNSLAIYRDLADKMGEAAELENVANVWQTIGQNQKALDNYRQCVTLDEELNDKRGQATDWGNMGTLLDAMSRYQEALEALQRSLKLHRETGDRQGQAMTLNNIGIVMMETGKLSEAFAKYAESLALAAEIRDKGVQAMALSNQGAAYRFQGQYGKALISLQESLKIEHESHNPIGEARSRAMIAALDNDSGLFHEALELFAQTVPIFVKEGMKADEAASFHNMAAVYQEMGQFGQAAAGYRESLRIKRSILDAAGVIVTLNNLAQLYLVQGGYPKAIETARQGAELAHKIGNPAGEALNTLAMADGLQLDGKLGESGKAYADALQLAETSGAPDAVAGAYTGLGSIQAAEHNWSGAAADCEKAIEAVETMRSGLNEPALQVGFFDLHQKPYFCLLNSLLALNRNEDALRTAERARARTLVEVLDRGKVDIYKGLPAEDRKKLEELDGRVAEREFALRRSSSDKLLRDLRAARQARDDLERVLYLKAPNLAVNRGDVDPVNVADLKALLPDSHAALIEYALGEKGSWLFVLRGPAQAGGSPELFVHFLAVDRQKIGKLAKGYWERLRKQGAEGSEGGELFRLLVAPAYTELAKVSTLGIVPDGGLWLVPFAALREPAGHYLVESKAIYYAPSLTALRVMDRMAEKRRPALEARLREGAPPLLLVGNPSLGPSHRVDLPLRGAFAELPQTAAEVQGIRRLPGIRADILLGGEATEARVRREADRYLVIHLATHGFYDSTNPMYSGIVLSQAGNSKEDGIWEAREIAEQNLSMELVAVSACDTARGEIFAGEGVLGLAWAFFVAGTSSSLLTDWAVNDASTSLILRQFYREWGIGNSGRTHHDKVVALQRAQKWMLAQKAYSDPYYWAPFVLIGAPR
ncbi:MAG TPA: CHAT domain-containing protein [Bryobacteraceae bacterium]|nr:CHAT domain-containing protein [Bryobacteraceae bacterium]